ncbi:16S rRNA (guanine(966)-N(2))-methyltransferase RsmD, partial [Mesorhizobium sp. M00.F.Ca.ET.186.01.1.1]
QNIVEEITQLQQLGLLAAGAWIVAEHDSKDSFPAAIGDCVKDREATYGETAVTLYYYEPQQEA